MLYLHDLNLDQNELQSAVIENRASAPTSPAPIAGQIYFNTTTNKFYVFDGTSWITFDSGAVTSITANAPLSANTPSGAVTLSIADATTTTVGVIKLAGDLGGTGLLPTVESVGGASKANIADAVTKRHTQNTDTGTTATSFQIDSGNSGPRLFNNGGIAEIRNAANSALANLRCNDLAVEGTLTYLHSTEVFIGDQYVVLNAQVLESTNNSNGGFEVRRLIADAVGTGTISGSLVTITGVSTTFLTDLAIGDVLIFGAQRRTVIDVASDTSLTVDEAFNPQPSTSAYSFAKQANARIFFDVTSNIWRVIDGTTAAPQTFSIARKHSASVGDGSALTYVVTHNLNTRDVQVNFYQTASPYAMVMTDWEATSVSTITVKFKKAPTSNQYRVVITG
ncbi:MAG: hypothetical protein WC511_03015 [Candidatus Pacearchaeota archaeon]